MYGCGVGGSAGNKSSGNHDNAIADLGEAKLQGNLLADAEELIGVGEVLVDYIGVTPLTGQSCFATLSFGVIARIGA